MDKIFERIEGNNKKACLVFLHGDEIAAKCVLEETQEKFGFGALFFNGSQRYHKLSREGVHLDLNRIWSVGPLEFKSPYDLTISAMSNWGLYSDIQQKLFRPAWEFLKQYGSIIALHNNGKSSYSFLSYFEELSNQMSDIWRNEIEDPGDFIVTTKGEDFVKLKKSGNLNVVLLNGHPDDQTLSCWSAAKRARYFNIETKTRPQLVDTIKKQREMLDEVLRLVAA